MLCELYVFARDKKKNYILSFQFYPTKILHSFLLLQKQCDEKFNTSLLYAYKSLIILIEKEEDLISERQNRTIQESKNPNEKFNKIFIKSPTQIVDFYTNRSKSYDSNHTGAAFISPNTNLERKFQFIKLASIFTAEAFTILHCLDIILNSNIPKSRIFTNYKSVLQAIINYSPLKTEDTFYLVLEIKKLICE